MRLLKPFAILACALSSTATAVELKPVVHLDARAGYASTVGQSGASLFQGSLFAVPALGFSDELSLVPNLYLNASGQERSIQEDTLFVRSLVMGARPSLRWSPGQASATSLRMEARRSMNVQALNDSLGQGYYDFEEFGAGLGWEGKALDAPVQIGLDASRRGYPYNRRLGSELYGGKNERVKDYNGLKGGLKATLPGVGLFKAALQWKGYEDAFVQSAKDGSFDLGRRQSDLYANVGIDGGVKLGQAWSLGWGVAWTSNSSNQNSFDATRNVGVTASQDYQVYGLDLGARWAGEHWKASAGYNLNWRLLNRPAQDPGGAYLSEKIADLENGLNLGLGRKLGAGFGWVANLSGRSVASNQQYQAGGNPNYSFYTFSSGFEWDWQAQ